MLTTTTISWFDDFFCIGGECNFTCCNASGWRIALSDEEIQRLELLDNNTGEITKCINYKEKSFKSKKEVFNETGEQGNYCSLLTEDGWCKLVLKYGDEVLSDVCSGYPRDTKIINNHHTRCLHISCPAVCDNLFNTDPVEVYEMTEPFSSTGVYLLDENIFECLYYTRKKMLDLYLNISDYAPGKSFIIFSMINNIQEAIKKHTLSMEYVHELEAKYLKEDVLNNILNECEIFGKDFNRKASLLQLIFSISNNIFSQINDITNNRVPFLSEDIKAWEDLSLLSEDLQIFYQYRDSHYPQLLNKYMIANIILTWIPNTEEYFGKVMKDIQYIFLIIMVAAMSHFKHNNYEISKDDFSYLVSSINRRTIHGAKILEELNVCLTNVEEALNFSMFLLPIY